MNRTILIRFAHRIDFVVLLSTLFLVVIGLLSIYSATHNAAVVIKYEKQLLWLLLGFLLLILVTLAPSRFYHYSAYLLYGISLITLILVLFLGKTVGGNAGWFGVGSFGVQPSEFAKVGTTLALARFLSDSSTSLHSFRDISIAFGIVFVPWILIFLQPDFGTGLVYWAIFLPMIFWAGAEMVFLVTLISPLIIAVLSIFNLWIFLLGSIAISLIFYTMKRDFSIALIFLALNLSVGFGVQYLYDHLPEYQRARVAVFLDPARAPQTSGYNVIQSKVAVGSGGLSGQGYLQGSQTQLRFVPEQWTDFIFCVPAEEFGFIGASLILLLFLILFLRGVRIARMLPFRFSSILVMGITFLFVVHVFVNIGMTLGLLPVVGIPLPFMSYGGSFFLTSMIAIGLLLHAYANKNRFES